MSCNNAGPEAHIKSTRAPDIPFIYAPYLDINSDFAGAVLIPESENQASDQSCYPIPPPLSSTTYPRRVEILCNLWNELRVLNEELRTVLDAENQKWRQWNKTQKDMSDWQIYLTNTRFVWCKKKWARFRYNVFFSKRKMWSSELHLSSCWRKRDEAERRMRTLEREAARQLRELDEFDQMEKLRRDSRSWLERLWMPSFMMEEIAIGRLANREWEKLEARYPHYFLNRRLKPTESTTI